MKPRLVEQASPLAKIEADLDALLQDGKPIRRDFADGSRLHIDRPLPFLCVHVGSGSDRGLRRCLRQCVLPDRGGRRPSPARWRRWWRARMRDHCGALLLLDIGELAEDRFLTEDAPFLPPFEIALASGDTAAEKAALKRFAKAASGREAKYRTPRVDEFNPTTRNRIARLSDHLGDDAAA